MNQLNIVYKEKKQSFDVETLNLENKSNVIEDILDYFYKKNKQYDTIFLDNVIHLLSCSDEIKKILTACNSKLEPGGVIKISTVNLRALIQDYINNKTEQKDLSACALLNDFIRANNVGYIFDWHEIEKMLYTTDFIETKNITPYININSDSKDQKQIIAIAEKRKKIESPKISVLMASYNHEKFVSKAIQSVLNQSYKDFEFIIIDDGSEDGTVEEINKIHDARIFFEPLDKNHGACFAINRAIRKSSGEYISIINSDDIFEENKLEKQICLLEKNKSIGAVFTHANYIDEDDNIINNTSIIFNQENFNRLEMQFKLISQGNYICHPSGLVRRDCYNKVGLYDERLRQLPDYFMWINILKHWQIHIIQERLVKFRKLKNMKNESANSQDKINRCFWENVMIFKEILSFDDEGFLNFAKCSLGEEAENFINTSSRIEILVEIAIKKRSVEYAEAAIHLLYEFSPRYGSGSSKDQLKNPSILATFLKHRGFA